VSKNPELKTKLNLPKTGFKMKANLPDREPKLLDWWESHNVYRSIREARSKAMPYVLHDGPPYANGSIHLGHALNKILKDFVVKAQSMMGRDASYVPGWDCHGLPIEHRIDKELGRRKKAELSILEFRRLCRKYAEKYIGIQSAEFRRLGVFWDRALEREEVERAEPNRKSIYRTIDRSYEAEIVRQLGRFFTGGSVYHGVKPVHWCHGCRTALAEAEVEYEDRVDPSIYVKFPVRGLEARVEALRGRDVGLLIWTTTPWTLPANLAVALNPDLDYVAVDRDGEALILAEGLLPAVAAKLEWSEPEVLARFTGRELVGEGEEWIGHSAPVARPYPAPSGMAAGDGVLLLGDHVTLEAGTGCVHTAPGHGAEDFSVGQRYGLDVFNPVGDDGRFVESRVGESWLAGAFVLDANKAIIEDLQKRGLLLHVEDYRHSYPHCWRSKHPVIFRSTPQWFISIDHGGLRQTALQQIRATRWTPPTGEARIYQMIETRPDWCISRQRSWGVPIPAVVCENCIEDHPDAFVREAAFFDHVAALFAAEGSDAWYGTPDASGTHAPYVDHAARLARLVPAAIHCPRCEKRCGLRFHDHIVDVWFESGVSHSAVLGDERSPWPADLYLEGHDQYRGWFHSSLLVAANDREAAPYREVLTHGFAMDAQGRKMSKSSGNVISPLDVAKKRGAEILRLWVSMVDVLEDMRLSEETLNRNSEAYRKIRNTFRYLLGNLHGFDPARDCLPYHELDEIDRWAVEQLEQQRLRMLAAYESHQHHALYHGLHHFASVTLSSFYLDILKDRLYTFPPRHRSRRSAQTALYLLADGLCRLMAPILCFTAEEIWQELLSLNGRPAWEGESVHAQLFPQPLVEKPDVALNERWERLMRFREESNKSLEIARNDKVIGTGLEARLIIQAPDDDWREFLESFGDGLHSLLITSAVELGQVGEGAFRSEAIPGLAIEVGTAHGDKCARCWHYTEDIGRAERWPEVCARCVEHISEFPDATEVS